MESDTIESSSESKFPLIAGIAGVALGVVALILAVKAKGAADSAAAAAAVAGESAAAAAAAVGSKANATDLATVASELSLLSTKTGEGFKQVENALIEMQKGRSSGRAAGAATAQVAGDGEYIVVKGDTLSGIARKLGISLKALQDLNPGAGNALRIGQKLKTK